MSSERATIMRHAGTVMVGQLAVMAFGITDTLVAGHFADTALAALAVASATYVTVHIHSWECCKPCCLSGLNCMVHSVTQK